MKVYNGSSWVAFTPKVYDAGTWKTATIYVGTSSGWQAWIYDGTGIGLGSASCTYWIVAEFSWTPPSTKRVISLSCTGGVEQHVPVSENQAVMDLTIEGWNGSSWVTLAYTRIGCDSTGWHYRTVTCSFNPYNTAYSQFRFRNTGNSFNRTITGTLTAAYVENTIPFQ